MDLVPDLKDFLAFGAGAVLTSLLLMIGHCFPLFTDNKLPATVPALLGRYTYGTMAIWLGAVLWLALAGYWWLGLGLMGLNIASGLTVALTYLWDYVRVAVRRSKLIESVDEELSQPQR